MCKIIHIIYILEEIDFPSEMVEYSIAEARMIIDEKCEFVYYITTTLCFIAFQPIFRQFVQQ